MGGRGASSSTSNNVLNKLSKSGVNIVDNEKWDNKAVNEALKGIETALNDFGINIKTITALEGSNDLIKHNSIMSVNGFNQLKFNNEIFSNYEKGIKATDSKGYTIASGFYGSGTHEAGHIIVNAIINKMKFENRLERANFRKKGKLEISVLKEAKKIYGSNPPISRYGSTKPAEKVAEAVSDVYTNKSRAKPYSKVIVKVLKKRYNSYK